MILLCFCEHILRLGEWSLRAYRESTEIVYYTYAHLSDLEFCSPIYIVIWIGASEPRTYIVDLIERQPLELGVGVTHVPYPKKNSCENI